MIDLRHQPGARSAARRARAAAARRARAATSAIDEVARARARARASPSSASDAQALDRARARRRAPGRRRRDRGRRATTASRSSSAAARVPVAAADRRARRHRGSAQRRRDPADGDAAGATRRRTADAPRGRARRRRRQGVGGALAHVRIATVVNIARAHRGAEGRQRLDGRPRRRGAPTPTPTSTGRCRRRSCWAPRAPGCGGWCASAAIGWSRIPMLGAVDSLNVSVAAGVVLYEAVRQREVAVSARVELDRRVHAQRLMGRSDFKLGSDVELAPRGTARAINTLLSGLA